MTSPPTLKKLRISKPLNGLHKQQAVAINSQVMTNLLQHTVVNQHTRNGQQVTRRQLKGKVAGDGRNAGEGV